ncbi:hypothetical protein [Jongsikchunia kroppenstedtii]|uniref:hypothetical protein n=1 Tax=Jongsikchunia kroppenstedtii TaxID=1121721 RepID=UPI00037010B8|nr:hypothetical protein [Jongsikchunia kroppenstedtii]
MKIDCDTCSARPFACGGCIMTVLMSPDTAASSDDAVAEAPPGYGEDDLALAAAVDVFGAVGMITPAGLAALEAAERAGKEHVQGGLSVIRRAG